MGPQAPALSRTAARVNGTVPQITMAAGRKGYRAELEDLRERMHGLGLGHAEIAAEIGRRYRARPCEAYRLAHGLTLGQAAARFNARAAELDTDPDGLASLAGNRLCEYEKWPDSQRRPSVYVLVMLAVIYQTGVLNLLDLADHEHLPPRDRLTLLGPEQPAPSSPDLLTATGAALNTSHPGAALPDLDPGPPLASTQGMSPWLPYLPGRVVIEVTGPARNTSQRAASPGDVTAPAITALRGCPPVSAAMRPAAASYGGRA
jgi:hypothetical protein